ncbi:MAG: hypothetical protein GDA36_04920 [Rhodobacteraceae bacterium]|nr:hypothetical protein [Paracoccaceae bacterium]
MAILSGPLALGKAVLVVWCWRGEDDLLAAPRRFCPRAVLHRGIGIPKHCATRTRRLAFSLHPRFPRARRGQ